MADGVSTLPVGVPDLTLGWEAVRWASKYLRHPNGPRAGKRWEFTTSQINFILWYYALTPDGRWLFDHAVRRLAKGSGKSPFAALIAVIELLAPVRMHHFDEEAPGKVIGQPVSMPLVQIAATAESQTANTMRMVRALCAKGSRVVADYGIDIGKTVFYTPSGGQLEVITSSANAAEGAEVTFAVADETEHWTPARGGDQLSATLLRNLAKSSSRMMETCNAWEPGIGSVAEETHDAWVIQQEGRQRGESRILYDALIAPADTDLADEASLMRGLNFAYGDCWWVDTRTIANTIWSPKTRPDVARRYYLNQPTASVDAWVGPAEWDALVDATRVVADREEVVLFFDGSKSRDATALIGCCLSDGHVFTVNVWEPDPRHDTDDIVSTAEVDAAVEAAFRKWSVVGFFGDVQEWDGHVKTVWPERYKDQLRVWALPSGKEPEPIAFDMRGNTHQFTLAAELVHTDIVEKSFTHDGDSRLARHVYNAKNRPNRTGVSIGKESKDSPKKIDAAICMIGARMVRRLANAAAPVKKPARYVTARRW